MTEFASSQGPRLRKVNAELSADDVEDQPEKRETKKPRSALSVILQVLAIIIGLIVLYLVIVPSPISPSPIIKDDPLPYFDGVLLPNEELQKIVKIGAGKLPGPESLQVDSQGDIYTGLMDGRIVKVEKSGAIIELARTGDNLKDCGDLDLEDKCGRPLGIQLDKEEENLYICDSYKGLMKLNLKSKILSTLIPGSVGINGVPFKLLNSLALSSDGMVYFTDSSWKWSRKDLPYIMLEGGGQGRLLSLNLQTNETAILLDGLFFSNGVVLSPDEDFILITETSYSRIVRVWVKGDRRGVYDIFADNLPGFPDNIRRSKDGGYWVSFATKREWPFNFLDSIGPYPKIKSLLAKILPKSSFESLVTTYGLIVKLDYYGDIVESYHDTSGKSISHISEVLEDGSGDVLYMGSYKNDFIGKLTLKK